MCTPLHGLQGYKKAQLVFGSKEKQLRRRENLVKSALGSPDWLESVTVDGDGRAILVIKADPQNREAAENLRIEAEGKAETVEGILSVTTVLTAEGHAHKPKSAAPKPSELPMRPAQRRVRKGARLSDEAMNQSPLPPKSAEISNIPGVKRILVVASAKGGVGKSTVSVNLAAAMAKAGMRVGVLDADVYGPSIPTMLGTGDRQPETNDNGKLLPIEAHGIASLSIGYLSDPDAPMIWRGPIVSSAILQMLNDADWTSGGSPLDVLIIDTPPGTGEAQLALAQKVPVTAAIIVTTPQEVALADVRRGAAMFTKTHVPVLGIVETMSWFEDPTGAKHFLMGEGGGANMAAQLGLPLMGQLPMLQAIREGGDAGKPAALSDEAAGALFTSLARDVAISLDQLATKPVPEIIFED